MSLRLLLWLGAICCFLLEPLVAFLAIDSGGAPGMERWSWIFGAVAVLPLVTGMALLYVPRLLKDHPRYIFPAAGFAGLIIAGTAILAARLFLRV